MKRVALFITLLVPFIFMLFELFIFQSVIDPIKYIYTITGASATVILFFSITLSLIKNKINLIKYRRQIGLFGFFYAFLHLLNFYILDAQFDLEFIIEESFDKPFIYLGMVAFFILLFMTITSTRNLFKRFKGYHKFVYLALILITIHFVMAQKSLTILQLVYILAILVIGYFKLLQNIISKNKI